MLYLIQQSLTDVKNLLFAVVEMSEPGESSGLHKLSVNSSEQKKSRSSRKQSQIRHKRSGRSHRQTDSSPDIGAAQAKRLRIIIVSVLAVVAVGGGIAVSIIISSSADGSNVETGSGPPDTGETSSGTSDGKPGPGSGSTNEIISEFNETYWSSIRGSCGTPHVEPELVSSRIVGGTEAKKNSWSWQIGLAK